MDFIGSFGNPNLPDILFSAERWDDLIALRTYDRAHGRKGRFLILTDALQAWLDGDRERPFCDSDCGSFLILRLHGGICRMHIVWLSTYGKGELHGVQQNVEIPENQLLALMQDGAPIRRLCRPQTGSVHFDARPSARVIRGVLSNKRKRRAFNKAMRDNFRWKDHSRVTLYPDGSDSFYFEASGDWPMCGGLILHEEEVRTPRGSFPKLYYGIHT